MRESGNREPEPAAIPVEPPRPRRVLVVDDDGEILELTRMILRDGGYEVRTQGSGEAALRETRRWGPDLILLDINMPQINGLEFLGHAKANPTFARVPVVIVSTEGKDDDILRGLKAGAAAYIKKPFQREQLIQVIGRLQAHESAA